MEAFFEQKTYSSFINGAFVEGADKPKPHLSPLDQKSWSSLHRADTAEIDLALQAVQTAQPIPIKERADILTQFINHLETYKEPIAAIIVKEMGKVIRDARGEVDYSIAYFRLLIDQVRNLRDHSIPSSEKKLSTTYAPIGPCFIMTPWNFPLAMGARKMAPALAAGCPIIARPSSYTPVSLLILGAIAKDIGLPKGLLNILIGKSDLISPRLMDSPVIKKISFTGSTEVGKQLYEQCAPTLKRASLELGGNAPLIVFDDANLEKAVTGAIGAKFRNNGQTCICANRIFVQKPIYEAFIEAFKSNVNALYIGDSFDDKAELSLVLHPASKDKVQHHLSDALAKGARPILICDNPCKPKILADVTPEMRIFNEETFGPLAGIIPFETDDEVLQLANQTPFGLAAYVFTENEERAKKAVQALEFGVIGVNDGRPSSAELPFGGVKASGFGKEGGPSAIYQYLTEKAVSQC